MAKKTENNQYKSNAAAARIAGISRQAICNMKKSGRYDFFTDSGKVDIEHPHWIEYLQERNIRTSDDSAECVQTSDNISAVKKNKNGKRGKGAGRQNESVKIKSENVSNKVSNNVISLEKINQSEKQKHALTGGASPSDFAPRNLADVERMAKIQNLNLQMRVRLGELIERDMVEKVIDVIANTSQSYFIDLPRKVSGVICKKLDRVGMEKTVEALLSPQIAKGISEMKKISLESVEYKIIDDMGKVNEGDG